MARVAIRQSSASPGSSACISVNPIGISTQRRRSERRLWVEIPTGFTEMQAEDPQLALDWRMATRAIFTAYFDRGYRALDFVLDKGAGRGRYLLALKD